MLIGTKTSIQISTTQISRFSHTASSGVKDRSSMSCYASWLWIVGKPVGWSTPPGGELSMGAAAERRNHVAKPAGSALVPVSATRSAAVCCGNALLICVPSRVAGRRVVRRLGWRGPEAERRGPRAGGQRHSGRAARHRRAALMKQRKSEHSRPQPRVVRACQSGIRRSTAWPWA